LRHLLALDDGPRSGEVHIVLILIGVMSHEVVLIVTGDSGFGEEREGDAVSSAYARAGGPRRRFSFTEVIVAQISEAAGAIACSLLCPSGKPVQAG